MSARRPWCLHSEVSLILIFRCKSLSWLPAQGGDEIASQKRGGKEKVEAVRQCKYNYKGREKLFQQCLHNNAQMQHFLKEKVLNFEQIDEKE